jgi:hypothetical protein
MAATRRGVRQVGYRNLLSASRGLQVLASTPEFCSRRRSLPGRKVNGVGMNSRLAGLSIYLLSAEKKRRRERPVNLSREHPVEPSESTTFTRSPSQKSSAIS